MNADRVSLGVYERMSIKNNNAPLKNYLYEAVWLDNCNERLIIWMLLMFVTNMSVYVCGALYNKTKKKLK